MNQDRLIFLLEQYRNGILGANERTELERTLLSSPQAREEFWRQARLHALLARWGQEEWGRRMAAAATSRPEITNKPAPEKLVTLPSVSQFRFWTTGRSWTVGLAAACLALLASAFILFNKGTSPSIQATTAIAVLSQAAGLEWASPENTPMVGSALQPGWLQFKAGVAQIEFYSGARVIIEAPANVELVTDRRLVLANGKLLAHVPEQARGFIVSTPDFTVTDLGTDFGVSAQGQQPTEIHVFTGKVLLGDKAAAASPIELQQGSARRWLQTRWQTIAADAHQFVTEDELARRRLAQWEERHQAWLKACENLNADPDLVVHYTFEALPGSDRFLKNQARLNTAGTVGSIVGCDWAEGRWPTKRALDFRHSSDRVRLTVTNHLTAVTLLAWVRVDLLPESDYAAVAVSDGHLDGHAHWQITRGGGFGLSLRYAAGMWERCVAEGVFTPEKLGRWTLLAAVYDSSHRHITLYADGQLVASANIKHAPLLKLGDLELGNWGVRPGHPHWNYANRQGPDFIVRNFTGRMDEFLLSARAWSETEVRSYYEESRPTPVRSVVKIMK